MARLALLLVLGGVLAAGCGDGIDRDDYARRNLELLESIPAPPSARLVHTDTSAYRDTDSDEAEIDGYLTLRVYATTAPAEDTIAFYRRRLEPGWTLIQQSRAPSLSFRRGDAYVHVVADPDNVFVKLDHDCFKGGPEPRC